MPRSSPRCRRRTPARRCGARRGATTWLRCSRASAAHERLVLDAVGLVGLGAELLLAEGLVLAEVALEPAHHRVTLERQHVGRDAIEEPAIMADDDGA